MRYYFDSCIWRDHYENRLSFSGRPIGKYATILFMKVIERNDILLFSELTINELKLAYDENDIAKMLNVLFLLKILVKAEISNEAIVLARKIAHERDVPFSDALHALIAKNNNAVLVSQDKHFQMLCDIVETKRPEEIS